MTTTMQDTTAVADDPTAFAGTYLSWMNGAAILLGVDAGRRAGLIDALAAAPDAVTSEELAAGGGFSERHTREWLALMVVAGIVDYEPVSCSYQLAPSARMFLTGDAPTNLAPASGFVAFSAKHVDAVAHTLRFGGGIPYQAYRPELTTLMDDVNRRIYDACLVDGYIERVPGVGDRLRAGAKVADVGCGSGHVVNLLARAFPASSFVGFDRAEDAIDAARAEAERQALDNARFELVDVVDLPNGPTFDLITAFDSIHDQAHPRAVLRAVRNALSDDGVFLMVDVDASSRLEDNLQLRHAPWIYGVSLFHCMQVSLAESGDGLGTAWGRQQAEALLHEAGFESIEVLETPPADMMNAIYICRVRS